MRFLRPLSIDYIRQQRWFAGKSKAVADVRVRDWATLCEGRAALSIQEVRFVDGSRESYFVPVIFNAAGEAAANDALADESFCLELYHGIAGSRSVAAGQGTFCFVALREIAGMPKTVRRIDVQQSNSSIVYDNAYVLKSFRRLAGGVNPELEIGRFLADQGSFHSTPELLGYVEYEGAGGGRESIAVLQRFVPNSGDGWAYVLGHLKEGLEKARNSGLGVSEPLAQEPVMSDLRRLGQLTGELHRALAANESDPAFAPEEVSGEDLTRWAEEMAAQISRSVKLVRTLVNRYQSEPLRQLEAVIRGEESYRQLAATLPSPGLAGWLTKIRTHGDYHLGQVLRTAGDFALIDFEGEPVRPLAMRRQKHLALRDVAGMLRSLNYAVRTVVIEAGGGGDRLDRWSREWDAAARSAFMEGYGRETVERHVRFVPPSAVEVEGVTALFELEKGFYELEYEANNRPDWLRIPLAYLAQVLQGRGLVY